MEETYEGLFAPGELAAILAEDGDYPPTAEVVPLDPSSMDLLEEDLSGLYYK